jgi:hypothetical protein
MEIGDVLIAYRKCPVYQSDGTCIGNALIVGKEYPISYAQPDPKADNGIGIFIESEVSKGIAERHEFVKWKKYFVKKSELIFPDQELWLY